MREYIAYSVSAFVAVFVIIDPFALLPLYLSMTQGYSPARRRLTSRKATIIGAAVLITFALAGTELFRIFGITLPALQIAGGLMLLNLGMRQLNAERDRVQEDEKEESLHADDISVFPLATPLLAGPGSISTVVLYASSAKQWWQLVGLIQAVLLSMLLSYVLLAISPRVFKALGRTGLNLLTRLMGIILVAVAIQFVIDGIAASVKIFQAG